MQRLSSLSNSLSQMLTSNKPDVFGQLKLAPPDPILGTALAYKADPSPIKMNLGIGAYRDDNEKPYVFETVRKAEQEILTDRSLDKEYNPIDGLASFNTLSQRLLFGENCPLLLENKVCTVQTLSGTGALRVGFEFLASHYPNDVYISKPTWGNHLTIVKESGLKPLEYPYFDANTKGLAYDQMIHCLSNAKPNSIVLLHVCAHNPTGVDPTEEQWKGIARVMKQRNLFPFFDSAYQGYASGDLEKDVRSVQIFIEEGFQFMLSQSFAKNFGLYGERIGALHIVCSAKDVRDRVMSQIKLTIRPMYSSPPLHGARIVSRILGNPSYTLQWKQELKMVSERIQQMRVLLRRELESANVKGTWSHITSQIGMFSFTGLTEKQCEILINKHHIYLLKSGRISMAGINHKNVKYLALAIKDAIDQTS